MDFHNKKIIILGAGREGTATAYYLQKKYTDCSITIADQQEIDWSADGVTTFFGDEYPTSLQEWDIVVVSPGIPPHTTLLATARSITTATNIFFADCKGTIIGVTGSKGKSTTSSLIYSILKEAQLPAYLCGNIGTAALDVLQQHNSEEDIFVVELSSYQNSRLVQGPEIAVVTSLFPEHLDYHGSLEQYYTDKLQLVMKQQPGQRTVYNQHNTELKKRLVDIQTKILPYPKNDGAHVTDESIYFGTEKIMKTREVPLLGKHNIENVLGAITVATEFDVDAATIRAAIMQFKPLPFRLEPIGTFRDIIFYNDSISTTPESCIAALNAIPNVTTLIAGGQDRGYTFDELAKKIRDLNISTLILFPDSGEHLEQALKAINYLPAHLLYTASMKEAAEFAFAHTPVNTVCLLSPASPSYNLFKNFEDRGNQFTQAVQSV